MRKHALLTLGLVMTSITACSRTVRVSAIDIETRQPVPGARVTTHYSVFLGDFFPPQGQTFVGDANGIVTVRISRGWEDRCAINVVADGYTGFYLTREGSSISPVNVSELNAPNIAAINVYTRLNDGSTFPQTLVAEGWTSPGPTFEIIVPDGFRGRLNVIPDPFNVVDLAPGQRKVEVRADPEGRVALPLTRPILASLSRDQSTYRFASSDHEIPKAFAVAGAGGPATRRSSNQTGNVPDDVVAIRRIRSGLVVGDISATQTVPAPTVPRESEGSK